MYKHQICSNNTSQYGIIYRLVFEIDSRRHLPPSTLVVQMMVVVSVLLFADILDITDSFCAFSLSRDNGYALTRVEGSSYADAASESLLPVPAIYSCI